MNITITTNDDADFKILDGDEELLNFQFEKRVRIMRWGETTFNDTKIKIESRQRWWWLFNVGTKKAEILKDGVVKGDIQFKDWWRGTHIRLDAGGASEKKYRLGGKIFRNSITTLIDNNKNVIFELKQNFKILKLKTEYEVIIKETQIPKKLLIELLIYTIYCAEFASSRAPSD